MRFIFRPRTTAVCLVLALCMLRLSYWQWERHLHKQIYVEAMNQRLRLPIEPIGDSLEALKTKSAGLLYRRFEVTGQYDFEHEVTLRNRRLEDIPGVFILTPLKLDGSEERILVSRGFVPLSHAAREQREIFRQSGSAHFVGLVKESMDRRLFAPRDPEAGQGKPWVDAWLRPDIENIAKQLPYPLLPVYLEIMEDHDPAAAEKKIVKAGAGREELLFMPLRLANEKKDPAEIAKAFPIPVFDTVIPAGRHLGYVFEWACMALMTILIGIVMQLRRPTSTA